MAELNRRTALNLAGAVTLAAIGVSNTPASGAAGAAPSAAAAGVILPRSAWGARPPRAGGRPHTITRMTIHHSAVALPDNRGIVARLQQHQRYHQDDKGWIDIAYHYAVDRNGNIFTLRDTAIAGDTATDYDTTGHFLVLCEGNFDEEAVSEAQLNGAALICAWAAGQFGITTATLASHKEVTPVTSCPGATLESHLTSGDLKRRIDTSIADGFTLTPAFAAEGQSIVATITAGTR
jgi:hypothetical protein